MILGMVEGFINVHAHADGFLCNAIVFAWVLMMVRELEHRWAHATGVITSVHATGVITSVK